MAKKVNLILPDETYKNLIILAKSSEMSMSAAAAASVEYFSWFIQQKVNEKYKIMLEKDIEGKKYSKEVVLPEYRFHDKE